MCVTRDRQRLNSEHNVRQTLIDFTRQPRVERSIVKHNHTATKKNEDKTQAREIRIQ